MQWLDFLLKHSYFTLENKASKIVWYCRYSKTIYFVSFNSSYLWKRSSSLSVSARWTPVLSEMLQVGPACTCPLPSPESGAGWRRWRWQHWGQAEGCCRSRGSPRRPYPCLRSRTPPERSGGCRRGCSGTSSRRDGSEESWGVWAGLMYFFLNTCCKDGFLKSRWHQAHGGRSCRSRS